MNLSLNQFMAEKEPEEDPDRLIYAYTSHISVPKWEDKNAKNAPKDCNHCSVKFSSGRVHNCRLCGQLFCSQCTEKYYLPYIFEKKDKQGPTRICVTCRDKCLIERIKEIYEKEKVQSKIKIKTAEKEKIEKDKGLWGYLLPFIQFNLSGDRREVEIEPPAEWDDINFFSNCKKCNKKGGKAHNCRTCGKLFCEKCTSKMNIPQFFDKKGKSGPARVCDNCRYLIVGGAKLVEKSSAAPLLQPLNDDLLTPRGGEESPNHRRPPSVNLLTPRLCTVAGCGQSRVTKNGYCAAHANEHTAGGGSGNDIQINKEFLMNITWEGERDPIGKIVVADDNTTLLTIDNYFRKQPFAINIDHFQYIYRGEPIPEAFYEIFLGKHFGKNIFIRKKLSKAFFQQAGINDDDDPPPPMPPGDDDDSHPNGAVAPVKTVNNPFKRAETDKLEAEKKKKEEEEEKKKKDVGAFKRPQFGMSFKSPALSLANAPPPSDKPPVPPPSAAINVTTIPENEDPFKARAKLLFGAK